MITGNAFTESINQVIREPSLIVIRFVIIPWDEKESIVAMRAACDEQVVIHAALAVNEVEKDLEVDNIIDIDEVLDGLAKSGVICFRNRGKEFLQRTPVFTLVPAGLFLNILIVY